MINTARSAGIIPERQRRPAHGKVLPRLGKLRWVVNTSSRLRGTSMFPHDLEVSVETALPSLTSDARLSSWTESSADVTL